MGHAIDYLVCDKENQIMGAAKSYAAANVDRQENPDGHYHGNMTVLKSHPICKDYEEAVEVCDRYASRGFYADYAVRFYDTRKVKKTKKIENLEQKVQDLHKKKVEYSMQHSVKMQKAAKIGCKKCGSSIAKDYLRTERCPVCGNELRADYILERLEKYDADIAKVNKDIRLEKQKSANKAPVRWCVKVEVHC